MVETDNAFAFVVYVTCCICTNTVTRAGLGRLTTTVNAFSPAQVHAAVAEREQWTCTRGIYVYNSY